MIKAAVIYFAKASNQTKMKALAESLAKGMETQGAKVDVFDGSKSRDVKLTGYNYLSVGCDVRAAFKGTVPKDLTNYLANAGMISGKRCSAFVLSAVLGTSATLSKLMKAMEHEGLILRFSEIMKQATEAQTMGKNLKLD